MANNFDPGKAFGGITVLFTGAALLASLFFGPAPLLGTGIALYCILKFCRGAEG